MAQTSALWVDHLLPAVPYRQFVLSFDGPMAIRLGYDSHLLGEVCRSFARRLGQWISKRVKQHHGTLSVRGLHPGIITVVQRFRSDLGLYVHLHCLVTDGAFEGLPDNPDNAGPPAFRPLPQLHDSNLVDILTRVAADHSDAGELDIDPGIAACVQLALGSPTMRRPASRAVTELNVNAFGMNLHAATTVDGRDRKQLERLCNYLLRPPFAQDAIQWLPDGRVRLHIARKARHVDMSPDQFIAKLAALVPPPGVPMIRYAGIFAGNHHLRRAVAPTPAESPPGPTQLALLSFEGRPVAVCRDRCAGGASDRTSHSVKFAVVIAIVIAVVATVMRCGRLFLVGVRERGHEQWNRQQQM